MKYFYFYHKSKNFPNKIFGKLPIYFVVPYLLFSSSNKNTLLGKFSKLTNRTTLKDDACMAYSKCCPLFSRHTNHLQNYDHKRNIKQFS